MATKKVILKEIVDGVAGDSIYPQTSIDQVEGLESALDAAGSVSTISVNNGTLLEPDSNKNINITVPSEVTESTVSGWGFTKNTGTYSKPSGGIPPTDLSSAVQTSLGKADTALQSHQDISGKEDKSNKVTSFSSPTDTQYPSAKLVSDQLATKQNTISDLSTIRNGATAGATAIQSVTVGTTTTGAAGSSASVTNTGTATEPILSFTIPQGAQGIQGIQGPQGERGPQGNTGVQVDSVASIIHSIDPTATYATADVAGADAVQDILKMLGTVY